MNKKIDPTELELAKNITGDRMLLAVSPQTAEIGAAAAAGADGDDGDDAEDFDWHKDDSVILREQRATAVYHNKLGELIIRQKANWDDEGDTFVYVTPENCNAFIDGIAARIRTGGAA